MARRGAQCEMIRADHGTRCGNRAYGLRDGHGVCGIHRTSQNPRYIEKAGKITPCKPSPPPESDPLDPGEGE